jgi:hypothetical protein
MSLILDGTNGVSDIDGLAATPAIRGTDANTGIFFPAADTIAFSEGGVESMRINSSGQVGIGTSSPTQKLDVSGAGNTRIRLESTDANPVQLQLITTHSSPNNNNWSIEAGSGGTRNLRFTDNLAGERMRIDTDGNLLVGLSSAVVSGSNQVQTNSNFVVGNSGSYWKVTNFSATYYFNYNGADKATINGSTGAYTALSDANKKKDFEPSTAGLDAVMALKPTLFRMIDDEETAEKQLGFLAQDVKDVIPQAYTEQDAPDGKFIGLQDRPIIAVLTKAIQELKTELDSVKAELQTMKGAA